MKYSIIFRLCTLILPIIHISTHFPLTIFNSPSLSYFPSLSYILSLSYFSSLTFILPLTHISPYPHLPLTLSRPQPRRIVRTASVYRAFLYRHRHVFLGLLREGFSRKELLSNLESFLVSPVGLEGRIREVQIL